MDKQDDQTNKKDLRTKKIFGIIPVISLIGIFIGAIGGYAYYYFIGCNSGTCAITSNPWMSMLWGAAIGYLLLDMFARRHKKKEGEN